ncbi:cation-chloride co-transporter protein, partial [Klebsormidium nitens]
MAEDGAKNPFDPTAEEDHSVVEMSSIALDSPSARPLSPTRRRVKIASTVSDANGTGSPAKSGYESITNASPAEGATSSPRSPSLRIRIENETPRKDGGRGSSKGGQSSSAGRESLSPAHSFKGEGSKRKTKFELFELDNLVNALGLRSMAGQSGGDDAEETEGLTTGRRRRASLGTVMGVFVPCLQNIMGIVLFIRLSWIVGMAGIGETLLLTAMCCLCTFITSLSLSAIATNGAMKGGGPYFLIGRALGPEVGVSIGICFFLGNALAASLYILGGVEVILDAVPGIRIFGTKYTDLNTTTSSQATAIVTRSTNLHDMQIYGVIITALLGLAVFGGAKIIARLGPGFLIPVMVSLLFIYVGIITAPRGQMSPGITGLSWHNFASNWGTKYQRTTVNGVPDPDGKVTWAFRDMLGLFFPAVTGILAGSNRSSVLKDPQRSIPAGTLSAHLTSTIIYFVSILLFGMVATRDYLLADRYLSATVAWPVPSVVSIG